MKNRSKAYFNRKKTPKHIVRMRDLVNNTADTFDIFTFFDELLVENDKIKLMERENVEQLIKQRYIGRFDSTQMQLIIPKLPGFLKEDAPVSRADFFIKPTTDKHPVTFEQLDYE